MLIEEIDPTGKPIITTLNEDETTAPEELIDRGNNDGSGNDQDPGGEVLPETTPPADETPGPQDPGENDPWLKIELQKIQQGLNELKQARQEKATRQATHQPTPQEIRAQRLRERQAARRRKVW